MKKLSSGLCCFLTLATSHWWTRIYSFTRSFASWAWMRRTQKERERVNHRLTGVWVDGNLGAKVRRGKYFTSFFAHWWLWLMALGFIVRTTDRADASAYLKYFYCLMVLQLMVRWFSLSRSFTFLWRTPVNSIVHFFAAAANDDDDDGSGGGSPSKAGINCDLKDDPDTHFIPPHMPHSTHW